MDEDGNKVIKDKKVWISKDGKKVELDDENSFQFNTEGDDGSLTGFGICYMGRFPEELSGGFGFEFGGSIGLAFFNADDLDSQFGGDFGIFLGPLVEIGNEFQAALHIDLLGGGGSGGDAPESIMFIRPGLRLAVYKSF